MATMVDKDKMNMPEEGKCSVAKSVWQEMLYYIAYSFMYTLSLLPLRLLYCVSDFIYLILYKIVGYRVRLVRKSLRDSFPQKNETELRQIERDFYHWFCDYIVETIKLTSMSEKEMRRRMTFEGLEQFQESVGKGQSCTLCLGHYCNWEWISSLGIHIPEASVGGQIYHELESPAIDRAFLKIRSRFRVNNIRMDNTFQQLTAWHRQGSPHIVGYICDQAPGYNDMHCWPFFLNHDTPVYTGPEKISRIFGCAFFYLDITRPKRGYYHCRIVKITDSIAETDNFYPTLTFFRMLEESIERHPQYWLWSHNRWKRTREEFNRIFTEEQRKKILRRP